MSRIPLSNQWGAVSAADWESVADQRTPWLIEGWVPQSRMLLLAGENNVGKSPLFYQLGFCIAAGIPFLGTPSQKGKVVIFDYENGQQGITKLLRGYVELYRIPVPEDLIVMSQSRSDKMNFQWNLQTIEDIKPDVAFIDTLGNAMPNLEDKNVNAREAYQSIRKTIRASGSSVGLSHHLRKKSDENLMLGSMTILSDQLRAKAFQQVRGAGAIVQGTDIRLMAEQHNGKLAVGGFVRLDGDLPPVWLDRQYNAEGQILGYVRAAAEPVDDDVDGAGRPKESKMEACLNRLPPEFSFSLAKQAYGRSNSPTNDMLRKALRANLIGKIEGGYRKLRSEE